MRHNWLYYIRVGLSEQKGEDARVWLLMHGTRREPLVVTRSYRRNPGPILPTPLTLIGCTHAPTGQEDR